MAVRNGDLAVLCTIDGTVRPPGVHAAMPHALKCINPPKKPTSFSLGGPSIY